MLAKYGKIIALIVIAYITLNTIIGIGWLGSTAVHKYGQGTMAKQSFDSGGINTPIYLLSGRRSTEATFLACTVSGCGHGICNTTNYECICDEGYVDYNGEACSYEQKSQLVAVILSGVSLLVFIVGTVNLCMLGYYCLGAVHCLTCGACRIGDIVLFVLFVLNRIYDANGVLLKPFY